MIRPGDEPGTLQKTFVALDEPRPGAAWRRIISRRGPTRITTRRGARDVSAEMPASS